MSYTKVGPNKYRIFVSNGTKLNGTRDRPSTTVETDLKGRDLERFLMIAEFDFEDEVKKKDAKFNELAKGTLENYANWWIKYKVEHEEIEATTKYFYQKRLKQRIIPFAGQQILEKLTNADMLALMKMIRESPAKTKTGKLGAKSIKHYHTTLATMFNDAAKLKILAENPMKNINVKAPKVRVKKKNVYDFDDIKKLLEKLEEYASIKHQLAVLLTMSIGNRGGELTAYRWNKVDLQNMKILTDESNAYTPETGSYIKDTKNESERYAAFPPVLVNLFLKHRENERLKRELAGPNWLGAEDPEDDFIFTQDNGKAMFVGSLPKWFRNFIKRHKLKHITFHGLRHTNATVLMTKGINVVSISHELGHAKPSTTTDLYSHHLESVEESMANVFEEIITENQFKSLSGTQSGTREQKLRVIK